MWMIMSVQPGRNTMEQAGSSFSSDQYCGEVELMRLVMKCIWQAISMSGAPGPALAAAACRVIALQARQRYQAVYKLWSDLQAASLRKLRAHLAQGDTSATHQQLSTLEWAAVDTLLLYDSSLDVVQAKVQFHPAQLVALERTLSLVQVLRLEPEGGLSPPVPPHRWTQAADHYSNNGSGVMLSALALQRRWHQMKQLARRRACGPNTPSVLHAIVHRYPHVARSEPPAWRRLVTAGLVAEPTSVPSPRAGAALQPAGPVQGRSEARRPPPGVGERKIAETDRQIEGKKDDAHDKCKDEPITAPGQALISFNNNNKDEPITAPDQALVSFNNNNKDEPITAPGHALVSFNNNNKEKPHCGHTDTHNIHHSKKICRKVDKTDIIVKPEITEIDDDTPSPKADVVEAINDMDLDNVDAMIIYESDDDVKTIIDVQMGNADKNSDIVRNEENNENVEYRHKIAGRTKYKIITDCKIERDIDLDCDNIMPFKQNEDDSSETAMANDNVNKSIDDSEENSMNIVISKVWSERDVQKASFHNNAEILRDDSDAISVGTDADYYSYYYKVYKRVLAKYFKTPDLDLKLLRRPIVALERLDLKSINTSPPTQQPQETITPSEAYEKNKPLLKRCRACEVSLTRVGGKVRKTRKVKLPDIEEVRKDNRGILTAEVAPLAAEPPRVIRQYGPARTKRLLNTSDNDRSVPHKKPVHAVSNTFYQNSSRFDGQQKDSVNNFESYLPSQDRNLFQDCQNDLQKDGKVSSNVASDSIPNLMPEMSENELHASDAQDSYAGPESQDVPTKNMTAKSTENTQNCSENMSMSDTGRVSTVTPIPKPPTMLTSQSVPIPAPPTEFSKHELTPEQSVPIPAPPTEFPKHELTPEQSVPIPAPPTEFPRHELTPEQSVPIPAPPTEFPRHELTPEQSVPIPAPPTEFPRHELTLEQSVPIPNLPTLTPKPSPAPRPAAPAPAPSPPTLTTRPKPKSVMKFTAPIPPITFAQICEPVPIPLSQIMLTSKPNALASFTSVPDLPEVVTPELESTPVPDQPIVTPKSEPTAEPLPTPISRPMLRPKSEPSSEPFASASNSTDLDQSCSVFGDNYPPIPTVDVNQLNPFKLTPTLQTSIPLNTTLNSFPEPSTHSEPPTVQVSLTSPTGTSKPSRKTYVKKSTKQPCRKKTVQPYILKYAVTRCGDRVVLRPLTTEKAPTKNIMSPTVACTPSVEQRKRKAEAERTARDRGPWRVEHESVHRSGSEFDMNMTFAEAYYYLYREDTAFERSVPLLNLL